MQVSKQTSIEWQVTEGGKHVAWIVKSKIGYTVTIKTITGPVEYFAESFAAAKAVVADWLKD